MLRNGSFLRRAAAASLCSAVAFGFGCNASLSSTQAAQESEISLRILKQLNAEQQAKLLAHPSFTTNAAVAILGPSPADSKDSGVRGSVVFVQPKSPDDAVIVRASITGLKPNSQHGFHIHTLGDLTKGCMSAGGHWNPFNAPHGGPANAADSRHAGDLGNLQSDATGTCHVEFQDKMLALHGPLSIIGRSVIIHADEDDLGCGGHADSKTTGHAGARIACGVIGIKEDE